MVEGDANGQRLIRVVRVSELKQGRRVFGYPPGSMIDLTNFGIDDLCKIAFSVEQANCQGGDVDISETFADRRRR
jgi:hypothetical protein